MAEIRVENLHKSFGDFAAVKNSNFVVENGEFFVLLGPSGCGKTTTLRMIAGLELPTSGRILLGGDDVTFKRAAERDIAFVFQLFALYPHMNVRKNIGFSLKCQGMAAAEINRGFLLRMSSGRPWVTVKIGASLDGRTALADGTSRWITGEAARADVQRLRARASAIVTGIGTVLADDPADFLKRRLLQPGLVKESRSRQQFIQQHPQRINVAPGIDVVRTEGRLLGAHVQRRADELGEPGEQRLVGELSAGRLGDAEVDDLHNRFVVVKRHQHVRRLDVAMDDPLLMRVLHRLADGDKQFQTLARCQLGLITVLGDGHAADQFHYEERPAGVRRPGVEHLRDVGMVHQRQRLPLGLEAGDDLPSVHPRLDDFEGHLAPHGRGLLGHEHDAEAPFADLLQQLVGTDHRARGFSKGALGESRHQLRCRRFQKAPDVRLCQQQALDPTTKFVVPGACLIQVGGPIRHRRPLEGSQIDVVDVGRLLWHGAES